MNYLPRVILPETPSSSASLIWIQFWSWHFDFDTRRVKPNPFRTTVPRGINHFLSATCTRQLPLSLYNTFHIFFISFSLSLSLFPLQIRFNSIPAISLTRRHNDAVLQRRNADFLPNHLLIRRRTRGCSTQQWRQNILQNLRSRSHQSPSHHRCLFPSSLHSSSSL